MCSEEPFHFLCSSWRQHLTINNNMMIAIVNWMLTIVRMLKQFSHIIMFYMYEVDIIILLFLQRKN